MSCCSGGILQKLKRTCPNCEQKAVSIVATTLWCARCKNCHVLVGTDQVKSWMYGLVFNIVLLSVVYVVWPLYGFFVIALAFVAYLVGLVLIEAVSPIVVREKSDR